MLEKITGMRKSTFSSLANLRHVILPSSDTISSALQSYINSDNPSHGQKIHALVLKSGYIPNTNIHIKLLILHLKCGNLNYARQVFDELPHRTLSAYNYVISGYVKRGLVDESLSLVRRLVSSGERPDGYTLSMILKVAGSFLGMTVHAVMMRLAIDLDDVICTALVDSYVKSGNMSYARRVFEVVSESVSVDVVCSTSMITGYMGRGLFEDAEEVFARTAVQKRDVVVFNSMIEGYSRWTKRASRSLEIFVDMQRLGFRPNISTFVSVVVACAALATYDATRQVQGQLVKTKCFGDVKIGSALIDTYSKCGKVEDARSVFDHMPEKNVFSWTSMIDGYGKYGFPCEALELFGAMRQQNVEPNRVTFLGALSACAHAGLVEEGLEIFAAMREPQMEHYACVVDLLGRAGDLGRAWGVIRSMPVEPNSDVWAALLSSCRLHGDAEMANLAAGELFKLKGRDRPGAYLALSNALADAGKWDHASKVRETMNERGISKGPGSSWITADL